MSNVKESKELVQAAVSLAKAAEALKAQGFSATAILGQLVITAPAIVNGLQGISLVDDEIKVIDQAGVEALVAEALLGFDNASPKTKQIVASSVNILLEVLKIVKA